MLFVTSLAVLLPLSQDPPLPPAHTGLLYVSGFNSDNVVELAPDGTLLRTFGTPDTRQPRGVSVDELGNIVVVCQFTDRIQRFDLAGDLLDEITHPDLTNGTGISRDGDGHWFVGNFIPGRVIEFDESWNHVQTITHPAMNGVNCVAVEADGSLSVTDAVNGSVRLFSQAGVQLAEIDHPTLSPRCRSRATPRGSTTCPTAGASSPSSTRAGTSCSASAKVWSRSPKAS